MERKNQYLLSSVNDALKVLDILSVKDNIGATDISKILKISKSSAFKILQTLEHRDYVYKDVHAKYHLGVKFTNYGIIAANRHTLPDIARIYMKSIAQICGETVCLAILSTNGKAIITSIVEGNEDNHMVARVGYEIDAYNNAIGKVLLSGLNEEFLRSLIDQMKFIQKTPNTIVTKQYLLREIHEIRKKDYCEQYEEYLFGHADIAVPVYDNDGKITAAIGIACPPENLKKKHQLIVNTLTEYASLLSKKLGYYKKSII